MESILASISPSNILHKMLWSQSYYDNGPDILAATTMNRLSLMLLVTNLANTKWSKNTWKMTETLANGYSNERAQRELSNEYQHDRV